MGVRILEEQDVHNLLFRSLPDLPLTQKLGLLLWDQLAVNGELCLSGVGTFRLEQGKVCFYPWQRKRVFLAYAHEDQLRVKMIYRFLQNNGFDPWMDIARLLPGQNWPRAIERAIESADFVVPCFSEIATRKRSHFHRELRYALEWGQRFPLDSTFLAPVRLEPCRIPRRIQQQTQYVDLFPDWRAGLHKLRTTLISAG